MSFINLVLIFSTLIILSSVFILVSGNPVQSILFLILCFILSSFLFILLGAEFLALLLLIVYVGAISILFLFVVMMLNLRLVEIYGDLYGYLPVGALIGFLFSFQMLIAVFYEFGTFSSSFVVNAPPIEFWVDSLYNKSNIVNLSTSFYNAYLDYLILASFILFVAMLGVILLTVDFEYRPLRKTTRPWGSFSFASRAVSSWKISY